MAHMSQEPQAQGLGQSGPGRCTEWRELGQWLRSDPEM